MKHLMFWLTALFFAVLPSKAQTTQVATLSHDGTITTFYSANALKDAYAAAVDGDIITLSSGTFTAVNIKKNITIRGSGMELENNPTIMSGIFNITCPASETDILTLEGLYFNERVSLFNIKDSKIVKCQFKEVFSSNVNNISVVNCNFKKISLDSNQGDVSGNFIGSYLGSLELSGSNTCITCTNCVLWFNKETSIVNLSNSFLKNCIIESEKIPPFTANVFANSVVASYCYYFGTATEPWKNQSNTNVVLKENPFVNDDYELAEEYKTVCVGDDGTEAGMYGGLLPFDPTPTNPQITKFNVASKTTADGKLSVDIEVKANN